MCGRLPPGRTCGQATLREALDTAAASTTGVANARRASREREFLLQTRNSAPRNGRREEWRNGMHPLRKLREAGVPTYEQVAAILNEHVVMHSPVLLKALEGREIVARALMNSTESRDNPGE